MIGQTISHYRVEEQIGAGGMGVVYRAHDLRLERDVALKVLSPALANDQEFLARFRREARILSRLNHPNIATVHDFDTVDGVSFLVMELIKGQTLDRKIRTGPLPESEILRLGKQLLEGLSAAHAEGIIHRDLKPGNLRETPTGLLKILDFGLARIVQNDPQGTQSNSSTAIVGTMPYMAPEQLEGEPLDARTDIYSTGVVLFELAAGRRPFTDALASRLIDAVLHRAPPSPREFNPDVSPEFAAVILQALEKSPTQRFKSAREMHTALLRLTGDQTIPISEPSAESAAPPQLPPSQVPPMEMAHILFTDIVGYSLLPMDEQQRTLRRFQDLVRHTAEFSHARDRNQLISLPTGDGMALVFFGEPESAPRCALELSRELKSHPEIRLRMGVNTGPVYRVSDINLNRNVAGGGINIAQRVMNCGDAGHILVSKASADVLSELSAWQGRLHDLGIVSVKHDVPVHLFNLVTGDAGNGEIPSKVRASRAFTQRIPRRPAAIAAAILVLLALAATLLVLRHRGSTNPPVEQTAAVVPIEAARPSVAVVGFKNISQRSSEDWISTSLSEDLTTELIASQKLRAVSNEEVSQARASMALASASTFGKVTLAKLKKNLRADYVVSGSFLATGSQADSNLNVDISLQSASTGETTDAYHGSGAVSALPSLVKQATARLFAKFGVTQDPADQAAPALPDNPEAARLYAQGLDKFRKFDTLAARDLFQRAISIEPTLALAHSALAETWSALGYDANAADEAKKAFTLSKNLTTESRRIIEGRYYLLSSQWDQAIKTYSSLSGVYQDEPAYLLDLAHAQTRAGKGQDALATIKQLRANPLWKDDPRIDLQEAYAAQSLSDLASQQRAASAAAQQASRNGSSYLAAEAYWLECGAYQALGQLKDAEAACRQSYASASTVPVYLARSQTVLATLLEKQGKTSEALELRKSALRTAKDIHSSQDIIGALMNLANLQVSQGQLADANKNYAEAFSVANEIGDKQHLMYLQSEMAGNLGAQGKLPEARDGYELSLKTAKEIGDQGGIADAYQNLAGIALQLGELSTADSNVQQSIAAAEKAGIKSTLAFSLGLSADILQARGSYAEAQKKNEQAQKVYASLQQPSGVADCQLLSASLALESGNASEAEKLAAAALHEYQDERLIPQEGEARDILSQALLEQARLPEAAAMLDAAEKLPDLEQGTTLSLRITRAKWLAHRGKAADADKLFNQALAEARRLRYFGKELEIRLAQARAAQANGAPDPAALKQLANDARAKGYLGIARQAESLSTTPASR